MSLSSWRMTSRFNACSANATAPLGGSASAHDRPVGSTMTRWAPSLSAVEIGVLLAIAPSIKRRPPNATEGNTAGIAALASKALVERTGRDRHLRAVENVGGDDVAGNLRVLEVFAGELGLINERSREDVTR